jgi:hypothetical protein
MKKNRGDEPTGVIVPVYMENIRKFPVYLYIQQAKMSFYLLFFFHLQNWKTGG